MISCKYTKTIKSDDREITTSLEVSDDNAINVSPEFPHFIFEDILNDLWDKFEEKMRQQNNNSVTSVSSAANNKV